MSGAIFAVEAFYTIAEIAATFVGFTGIIVAIRMAIPGLRPPSDGTTDFTILGFLAAGLAAIFFAFLPDLLFGRLPETTTEWRIACAIFGGWHFLATSEGIIFRKAPKATLRLIVISQPAIWLKITVGFGYLTEYAFRIYLFGLIWLLFVAMVYFVIFVRGLRDHT